MAPFSRLKCLVLLATTTAGMGEFLRYSQLFYCTCANLAPMPLPQHMMRHTECLYNRFSRLIYRDELVFGYASLCRNPPPPSLPPSACSRGGYWAAWASYPTFVAGR